MATSENIGLANNGLRAFATSVYSTIEKIGIEYAQAALAQLVITMCLFGKGTRSYRGLDNAFSVLKEPGMDRDMMLIETAFTSNSRLVLIALSFFFFFSNSFFLSFCMINCFIFGSSTPDQLTQKKQFSIAIKHFIFTTS